MFGQDFLRRLILTHGIDNVIPKGEIKDWNHILVYICETCHYVRLFWLDEMKDSDIIGCKSGSCNGTMRLYDVPMDKAKTIPEIWERIELHAAMRHET
ncbi:MAG: hypothetical protein HY764_04435 [Candidatus Portnoybacteria bacterium]|nr:hypothetical protein [Candidatus Portnoybacteria bacterium]